MYYVPKYFKAYELLPPDIFQKYGVDGLYFMDDRITWTLDCLRQSFGKITVNNWKSGGPFSQRGYRSDQNIGAPFSAHRFGRAVDFDIVNVTAEEFRIYIRDGVGKFPFVLIGALDYITRIEDLTDWIHIDCMGLPRQQGEPIVFFKP
jgi:hypothetical protein